MRRKGFTLVEIMIVVAIIALLAAIAIPNLLRARLTANESSAIATLRSLSAVCESYRAAQTSPVVYPPNLAALTTGATPPYIAGFSAAGVKAGYTFTVTGFANAYNAIANPVTRGTTGNRSFCVDHTGVLRADPADIVAKADGVLDPGCGGTVIE